MKSFTCQERSHFLTTTRFVTATGTALTTYSVRYSTQFTKHAVHGHWTHVTQHLHAFSAIHLVMWERCCVQGHMKVLPTHTSTDLKGCDCSSGSACCGTVLHRCAPDCTNHGNKLCYCRSESLKHPKKITMWEVKKYSSPLQSLSMQFFSHLI